jgi:hypothetical protein
VPAGNAVAFVAGCAGGSSRHSCSSMALPVRILAPHKFPPSPPRVDTDHEELFRQESYFAYLTGVVEPDCWATIELPSGRSTLFVPRLDDEYAVWMGELRAASEFGAQYRFEDARYVDELQEAVQTALLAAGGIPTIGPCVLSLHLPLLFRRGCFPFPLFFTSSDVDSSLSISTS